MGGGTYLSHCVREGSRHWRGMGVTYDEQDDARRERKGGKISVLQYLEMYVNIL